MFQHCRAFIAPLPIVKNNNADFKVAALLATCSEFVYSDIAHLHDRKERRSLSCAVYCKLNQ
jgi:hypothetical protein